MGTEAGSTSSRTLVQESSIEDLQVPSAEKPGRDDSGSEDSCDEEDDYEHMEPEEIERHNDHWDRVIEYSSPWTDWSHPGESWWDTHVSSGEYSIANDQLHTRPLTQQWLSKLASLQRTDFSSLQAPRWGDVGSPKTPPAIPLFVDTVTGDEYQLLLSLSTALALVWCPAVSEDMSSERGDPLCQVRYRISSLCENQTSPLPKFVIPLGSLLVRTTARFPDFQYKKEPATESTDYDMVIDVEREEMPVWLLCSRRRLRERVEEEGSNILQLPIFGGGMQNDEFGYDAACVFDSVHQIGSGSSLEAACDLVRRTRAVADPSLLLGVGLRGKLEEFQGKGEGTVLENKVQAAPLETNAGELDSQLVKQDSSMSE